MKTLVEPALLQAAKQFPVFASDLVRLRGPATHRPLSVFICGKELKAVGFDLRYQIKALLNQRFGCLAFLGEEIPDLLKIKADSNHLTIETRAATQSDLTVMFLGSPGTFAELTAFAMNQAINGKLLVFNEERFRKSKSFVNLGPLKLLSPDQKIYFEPSEPDHLRHVLRQIDLAVARSKYQKLGPAIIPPGVQTLEQLLILGLLYVLQPISYRGLVRHSPFLENELRELLTHAVGSGWIVSMEKRYALSRGCRPLTRARAWTRLWGEVRLEVLSERIHEQECRDDLRSIM